MQKVQDILAYYTGSLIQGDIPSLSQEQLSDATFLASDFDSTAFKTQLKETYAYLIKFKNSEIRKAKAPILVRVAPLFISKIVDKSTYVDQTRIYPYWIPLMLSSKGELYPSIEHVPFFDRQVLLPMTGKQDQSRVLSDVLTVSKKLDSFSFNRKSFQEYFKSCQDYFKSVTQKSYKDFTLENYHVEQTLCLIEYITSNKPTGLHELYEFINNKLSTLELVPYVLENQFKEQTFLKSLDQIQLEDGHYGQFNNQFPLSPSQRQALLHFVQQQETSSTSCLAVNGPPGTGKTTLLQSILANEIVKSALVDQEPARIIASSANNQAITNILDSFESQNSLDRWIPGLNSLGTYLTNNGQTKNQTSSYQTMSQQNGVLQGLYINGFENSDQPLSYFKDFFIDKYKAYFNHSGPIDIPEAIQRIKQTLEHNTLQIQSILQQCKDIQKLDSDPKDIYAQHQEYLQDIDKQYQEHLDKRQRLSGFYTQDFTSFFQQNKQSKISVLYGNLNKKHQDKFQQKLDLFFMSCPFKELHHAKTKENAQEIISTLLIQTTESLQDLELKKQQTLSFLNHLKKLMDDQEQSHIVLRQLWKDVLSKATSPSFYKDLLKNCTYLEKINIILDLTLRYENFILAVHFWEAKWILEKQDKDLISNKGKKAKVSTYTRMSYLTPLFVSTAHSLPGFCKYTLKQDNHWRQDFLTEFFDILIVDEAGQVPPEIGMPLLALAKRAVIVGDVEQIEPIWRIQNTEYDKANLTYYQVNQHIDLTEFMQYKLHCSAGSFIHVAQGASPFKSRYNLGGAFLTEHRRCVNSLIAYSNENIYKGMLTPMVGGSEFTAFKDADTNLLLTPFAYLNVKGTSKKSTTSLSNEKEAQAIAKWIAKYQGLLKSHYGKSIQDTLAVVTPFAGQTKLIKKYLIQYGLSKEIIVGTVHSLQGAERPLIIFSPTYGINHKNSSYFFNRGYNMFNVAITRAKDHFLVMGNMRLFDKSAAKSPANDLAKHLFEHAENELSSAFLYEDSKTDSNNRIASLELHRKWIDRILKVATKRMIIVSPFISYRAIEADGLISKIQQVKLDKPDVKIIVYTDSELDKVNGKLKPNSLKGRQALESAGVEIRVLKGIHNKAIIKDNDVLVEGSFNWLSAVRDKNSIHYRHEVSHYLKDQEAEVQIQQLLLELESIEKIPQ